jgi:hypothetical protein
LSIVPIVTAMQAALLMMGPSDDDWSALLSVAWPHRIRRPKNNDALAIAIVAASRSVIVTLLICNSAAFWNFALSQIAGRFVRPVFN